MRRFGVLILAMTGDTRFEADELTILRGLLEPIGMALDNVFLYSQVEKLATCDSMTGAYNHQNIREKMLEAMKMARRQEGSVSVLLADIDRFKNINDTYGHPVGDKVIKEFAKILNRSRRTGEYVGRLGGEEFLVVLGNTSQEGARAAAERILQEIRATEIALGKEDRLTFRVSMGLATFPQDGGTLDELIDRADRALYMAKSQGRDRFIAWETSMVGMETRA